MKCNQQKFVLIFLLFFAKFTFSEQAEKNSQMPSLQKIGDAKFRFGGVIIDQRNRIIEFNATCNQRNGLIEYALVHESGKTHESLFRTTIRPQILHACFLLLKHPAETRFFKNLWSDNPKKLNFDKNRINTEVVWDQNGTILSKSLEDLALNTKNNEVLIKGALIFTGSKKLRVLILQSLVVPWSLCMRMKKPLWIVLIMTVIMMTFGLPMRRRCLLWNCSCDPLPLA